MDLPLQPATPRPQSAAADTQTLVNLGLIEPPPEPSSAPPPAPDTLQSSALAV